MDEKTKILISLGASVAANCVPCFEHYLGKTEAAGLTPEEIREATDIGDQVKKRSADHHNEKYPRYDRRGHIALQQHIR